MSAMDCVLHLLLVLVAADAGRPASQPAATALAAASAAPRSSPAELVTKAAAAALAPRTTAARHISLELAGADVTDALRIIAAQGGLNLVIGADVSGKVSVALNDVPVEDALRAVALGNGFTFTEHNGIVTVARAADDPQEVALPPMVTRVFRPRSVSATDLRWALEPALSNLRDQAGQRYARITVLNEDSRPGYGLFTLAQDPTAQTGTATPGVSGAPSAAPLGPGGVPLPGHPGGGDPTNYIQASQVLIVTDIEENVQKIARLVEELDRPPPQVLIEARIVEMTLTLQKQLGIDWNVEVLASGPRLQHQFPLYRRAGFAVDTSGSILPSLGTVDFQRFQAVLQANQDDGGVRLLANPRMLVHNNHRAVFIVGERYPILRTSLTDFGTATESFEEYIPVGIQLFVTPTVLGGDRVSLLVHPASTALGDDVVGSTGLRVARINTREMDTRAIVRDGQTVVLGGLISDRRNNEQRKVAGLGEVPVLNWLFRQERRRDERVDLLIFLTVHIDGADRITARDQAVWDTYKPHFKRTTGLRDVPLQFEVLPFDQEGNSGNGTDFPDRPAASSTQEEPPP